MRNRIHAAIAFCFVSTAACAVEPVATAECQGNAIRLYAQPLAYEVVKDGKVVVPRTEIGLRVDGKDLGEGASGRADVLIRRGAQPSVVETPVYKKASIDVGREEQLVDFGSDFAVRLVARPDGVAYRFELKKGGVVVDEKADLTIPKNARCWFNRTPRAKLGCEETEPEFADASALKTDDGKAFYLPFVYSVEGKTVAVMDTDVHDYPVWYFGDVSESESGVRLSSLFAKYPESTDLSLGGRRGRRNRVRSNSDFIAKAAAARTLPWRVFALADSPSKLCEADISYALGTPPLPHTPTPNFSWVKPGKVAWDWWNAFDNKGDPQGCTTETYVRFIDFAASNGVEYVIFDEGWSAKLDIWKFSPNVDVPYLIDYANKKGVGIILWMAWCQVEGDEERVVEHFAKLGAKGFKVDFIDRADAQVAVFMEKFAEVCAKHKMLVDYHGSYRPVGLHRTYPNVLNYEGIHGLEQMKWSRRLKDMPYNDVAAFFLRMTAGPMDYTPGAMDNYPIGDYRGNGRNPGSVGTRAHQMALMALYEAPLQMLADAPTKYEKNMECFSFMAKTPVVWDATVGLGGTPESYAAVARKSKDGAWYAAAISNREARDIEIDTSFLGNGEWKAEIFRDADDADKNPTHYVHEFKYVKAGERLKFHAAPGGGFVIAFKVAPSAGFCEGWRFRRVGEKWQTVSIPHDDAIRHDFNPRKYGTSCGALPYFGKAEYEKTISVSPDEWQQLESGKNSWRLEFDGVMSGATVAVNGKTVYSRPWGYSSFIVPLDGLLKSGDNTISVNIDAKKMSSRWYPGFGIYRDVRLVKRPADHVIPGSVAIWTPEITAARAVVKATWEMSKSGKQEKTFTVEKPELWSPETPRLYTVELGGETFRYGIRTLRFDKTEGFFLNGKHRQMRGVCLHHDLGVFGAEFEVEAARRQLALLKEMGCDAIRTAHNFPAPGLLDLCDEMGFMVMDEAFDEWRTPKWGVKHGMSSLWDEWHEREIVDFVRRDRNHPCVVMWSAGNELPEDGMPARTSMGIETARELTALFHANDPQNRPVTAGHWKPQTISNGIGEATDVFGANYLPKRYAEFKGRQGIIGTETCSVVSSRGVYAFPIDNKRAVTNQVPSWDLCPMHPNDYIPDVEFAAQDANPHVYGEFVWTGFDYLGEPDPWRGNARSSYFGIFDLCGFPKDRYWIYKAKWRPDVPTAHILPHWNWTEGMKIPVHVYTSGDEAELFVNGVSQGRKRKGKGEYRLKWDDVPYAPGEVSVKTWKNGAAWAEDRRVTAGKFHHFEFTDKSWGEKYVFRTVMAVDEKGVFVPDAAVVVDVPTPEGFEIFGTCNGDAADFNSLRSPKVKTFSGMALVVYRRR